MQNEAQAILSVLSLENTFSYLNWLVSFAWILGGTAVQEKGRRIQ